MSNQIINIALWICQGILGLSLLWASSKKLFTPRKKLQHEWPWVGESPAALVKVTGLVDLAGALGLVLPMFVKQYVLLVPLSAIGIFLLMVSAAIFHIRREEVSEIKINIVFAVLALIIAYGRWTYTGA